MSNFFRSNSRSSASSSSSNPPSLKEEINFSNLSQSLDNWKIPKHPSKDIYKENKWKFSSDYSVKTVEQTIPLSLEHEEIKLLSKKSIDSFKQKYNYLHFGLVQIAAKPLSREGLDTSLLLCLRDSRFLDFNDSLLGMVETSLCGGPVHFDCFPNFTVSLKDLNILDSLTLNIKTSNYKTKPGSLPVAIIFRLQYKALNSAFNTGALRTQNKGETILFQTDFSKSHLSIPKSISWNQVTLPPQWVLPKALPPIPAKNTTVSNIKQFNTGSVEISFDRSQSTRFDTRSTSNFSSNNLHDFQSNRPSVSSINTQIHGMRPESSFPQASYTVQQDSDSVGSPTYSSLNPSGLDPEINMIKLENNFQINKEFLRKEFFAPHNEQRKQWFFQNYKDEKRNAIQNEFYSFLNHYQIHVQFFDWFSAYAEQNQLEYPFIQ